MTFEERQRAWERAGERVCRKVLEGDGSQVDFFDARCWWDVNLANVARSGQCVRGCQPGHLIAIGAMECNRETVCIHTGQPCQRQRLAPLLDLYSQLNRK